MAQYQADEEREDYSDIGDVESSLNFSSLVIESTSDVDPVAAVVPSVPIKKGTNEEEKVKGKGYNKDAVSKSLKTLRELGDSLGVPVTMQMESQVKSIAMSKGEVSSENMEWYFRGIVTCQSSSVLPSLKDATSEIRSEVKRMQISANEINKIATTVEKSSKSLQTRIEDAASSTRAIFDASLENISTYVEETISSVRDSFKPQQFSPPTATEALSRNEVIIPILKDDKETEKTPGAEITVPEIVDAPKELGKHKAASSADDGDVTSSRKNLLLSVGFNSMFVNSLTPELLVIALPPSLMSEAKGMKMTTKIRMTLKRIVTENLSAMVK